jgi:hypothetical protein
VCDDVVWGSDTAIHIISSYGRGRVASDEPQPQPQPHDSATCEPGASSSLAYVRPPNIRFNHAHAFPPPPGLITLMKERALVQCKQSQKDYYECVKGRMISVAWWGCTTFESSLPIA